MGIWLWQAQAQDAALRAQLCALQARSASVSAQLQEATEARPRLLALLSRQKRITRERTAPGWAPVLRSVIAVAGGDIQVEDIQARGKPQEPGVGELRISGVVVGESPRGTADRFRADLEAKLGKALVANALLADFAPRDDGPNAPGKGAASRKAAFTIVVPVGLNDPAAHGH